MRITSICPKCRHNEILHTSVPDNLGETHAGVTRNMQIAFALDKQNRTQRYGDLSASVCRRCGYTEMYCAAPDKIPVDGKWVTTTVGRPS